MGLILQIIRTILFILTAIGVILAIILIIFDGDLNKIKGKKEKAQSKNKKKEQVNKKQTKESRSIKTSFSQDFLDFEDIKIFTKSNPMGLIIKENKTRFIGVIEVFGINYNLLSTEERFLLEENFAKLLNGLDYNMQIYIQSKQLNIEDYAAIYDKQLEKLFENIDNAKKRLTYLIDNNENESAKEVQIRVNRLSMQYNYGVQIRDYIIKRSQNESMLERKYYFVLTHKHNTKQFKEELTYEELLNNAFYDISNKANSLISALQRANLGGKTLSGTELIELLYVAYNKGDSETYKLKNAIRSQFNHLYTTAEPVDAKRIKYEIEELSKKEKELESELLNLDLKKEGA